MVKNIEGQMSIFDFIEKPKEQEQDFLPCDTCGHDIKGCCDYDYLANHDYCRLGDKWIPKEDKGAILRYLRHGPHTLIPEVREKTKAWLDKHGVPEWANWDKNRVPCDNCTWYDGRSCCSGGHTNHFEYGFLICDGFKQSIVERKPSTVGDEYPNHRKEIKIGDWVEDHGSRIHFDDIKENQIYIADYSTQSHKWYKVIYVKWIKDDSVGYVDSEKGVSKEWGWGNENSHSCLTRKMYIDAERNPDAGEADTSGWWYELPFAHYRNRTESETLKDTVTMFGKEWTPIDTAPKGITDIDDLAVLGTYKYNNEERWSECPAHYDKGEIVPYNVPFDIPRPVWKYWRLKEKVHDLDIRGICDDPYCPQCGRGFWTEKKKSEIDCERCPDCHIRISWRRWHLMNDEEDETDGSEENAQV